MYLTKTDWWDWERITVVSIDVRKLLFIKVSTKSTISVEIAHLMSLSIHYSNVENDGYNTKKWQIWQLWNIISQCQALHQRSNTFFIHYVLTSLHILHLRSVAVDCSFCKATNTSKFHLPLLVSSPCISLRPILLIIAVMLCSYVTTEKHCM